MRKLYRNTLKNYFYNCLMRTRAASGLTQAQMAEKLAMDDRSYIKLDHGKTCCSAVTLALYIAYACEEPAQFAKDLRSAFEAQIHELVR